MENIHVEIDRRFKDAMRARDARTLDVLRAVRTRIQQAKTAKGFEGEVDDALYLQVIEAYAKSLRKAIPDFERGGERGAEMIAKLQFEVGYLEEFLPKKLGEDATRVLVQEAIAAVGATSRQQMGRVIGVVMKDHRDAVDAGLVRSIAETLLG